MIADQLRSVIDRILRLKEEQDALGDDVREVYAEAKSNGYDKTALGQAVAILRKRKKQGEAAMAERDALVDLYLTAYERPSHAHARETPEPKKPVTSVTELRPPPGKPAADDDFPDIPEPLRRAR